MLYEGAELLPETIEPSYVEVSNDWKQVVVISGEVESADTSDKLEAPCIVPPKVG